MASLRKRNYRRVPGYGRTKRQIFLHIRQQVTLPVVSFPVVYLMPPSLFVRDSWFLNIRGVQESDAGKYICQLNTERPISISGTLSVVGESMVKGNDFLCLFVTI